MKDEAKPRVILSNDPKGLENYGLGFRTAESILNGNEDTQNTYWNSFLPIFFDRITALIRKDMTDVLAPYGLTSAHSFYLVALNLIDGQTLVELSKFLDMDAANTNRVIKTLIEKGYVRDDRATPTSKKFRVYLTKTGKDLADLVMVNTRVKTNDYFSTVTSDEVAQLRSILIRILNNIDPQFKDYVASPYINPFYVYLNTHPPEEKTAPPSNRVGSRD